MPKPHIHAAYCRCPRCEPRHPAASEISPVLRFAFPAIAIVGVLAALAWAGSVITDALSVWSPAF